MQRVLRTVLRVVLAWLPIAVIAAGGCQRAYYGLMEAVGREKRDLLVDRVEAAREQQEETRDQFASALDRFSELVRYDGSDLRAAYDAAGAELEQSEEKAAAVSRRIDAVETVGGDLFREWEDELDQYTSAELRRQSESQLRATRGRYEQMLGAMRRAERSMEPVLAAFRDQVLSLKHNLNAQAVAALEGNVADLEREITELIRQMEASMAEADRFLREMGTAG